MRKYSIPVCVLLLICSMCFCALGNNAVTLNEPLKWPMKEGIEPYNQSEQQIELMKQYGMEWYNAPIWSYKAPEEAKRMEFNTHVFQNGEWQLWSKGMEISIEDMDNSEPFEGTITLLLHQKTLKETGGYWFEYRINDTNVIAWSRSVDFTELLNPDIGYTSTANHGYQRKDIVLGEEIPIAIWAYEESNRLGAIPVFDSELDKDLDISLAIAVTVTFSE